MTEHAESPIGPRDEEEQVGRGGECKQALGEGERGKQGRQSERGGTGRSRVGRPCFPHPEEGIQLKWPNPLLREYPAFRIL